MSANTANLSLHDGHTYHIDADDLTVGLLDLAELGQEVPEPGLSDNSVGREDAHAVQLGRGVSLGGQVTPNDLVLGETPYGSQSAMSSHPMRTASCNGFSRCVYSVRNVVDSCASC